MTMVVERPHHEERTHAHLADTHVGLQVHGQGHGTQVDSNRALSA